MFQILYGRNRVYILLVTSANGYLICFGAQGCGLKARRAFVVVMTLALGDGVYRNLPLIAVIPVVSD